MGGSIKIDSIHIDMDSMGSANIFSHHLKSSTSTLQSSLKYLSDKMSAIPSSIPIEASTRKISLAVSSAGSSITKGIENSATSSCKLLSTGTIQSAKFGSLAIDSVADNLNDAIRTGFNTFADATLNSFTAIANQISESTSYVSKTYYKTIVETNNEMLLTIVSIFFVLVPFLFYILIAIYEIDRKKRRRLLGQFSTSIIITCGIGALLQYFRYVFTGSFTIINISISLYMGFYALFSGLYLVFLFFVEIKNVYNGVSYLFSWIIRNICCGCNKRFKNKPNKHEYHEIANLGEDQDGFKTEELKTLV